MKEGDNKSPDRLAFLSENGYIKITPNNEFSLTERGQQLLTKI
jgi:predicted transcriptional regulator